MPVASKENDCPVKIKNSAKADRSPARRKQQHHTNEPTSSSYPQDSFKKPFVEIKKDNAKGEILLTPGSFSASTTKSVSVPVSPKQQYFEYSSPPMHKGTPPTPSSPSKDILSTSPTSAGRWAGPAFGNAPHPSNLPLPQWTSESQSLSTSPPAHDSGLYLQAYPPHTPPPTHHFLPPSPSGRPDIPFSSIPVVPFPYVGSAHVPPMIPSPPSLDQLSTDLRRLLNINGGPIVNSDPILVSANSS